MAEKELLNSEKNRLKLFQVTEWLDSDTMMDTFENLVIAGNETEAKRIVDEELSGMKIKCIKEINMTYPQLICAVRTDDFE